MVYFISEAPQYGQFFQSACIPRLQEGQVCAEATGLFPLPSALTSQTMPSTVNTIKPRGISHMKNMPMPNGANPQRPIMPGPIIPQPPYPQPPSKFMPNI